MSSLLGSLRDFSRGLIDENELAGQMANEYDDGTVGGYDLRVKDDDYDDTEESEFVQECTSACLPTIVEMMMMDEAFGESTMDTIDENVKEAFMTVHNWMQAQGLISEAATVNISNPKVNVVHLNKNAQINRLTSIITLKMARKENSKNYQKYKIGQKIKKENMAAMRQRYGAKAERLARKIYAKTKKSAKTTAVVKEKTPAPKAKKK